MKKRSIPQVPKPGERRENFDAALKENLELIQGLRGSKVQPLASTATTAEIIEKINELIALVQ